MRIIWTNPARRDLNAHVLYLAERNPEVARRVRVAIRASVEAPADQPHRGRPGERTGTRELVITAFPAYIVVYRVTETDIRVLSVWHGRQDRQR
jgi:toxin ParE1/3/4